MSTLEFNQLPSANQTSCADLLWVSLEWADADDQLQDTMVKALRYKNNFKEGTNMKGCCTPS